MGSPRLEDRPYTKEEYFALLEQSEVKLEFHDGEIVMMAGAKPPHNKIQHDLSAAIARRDHDCEGFGPDQAIAIPRFNRYVFPDLSFVCTADEYDESGLCLVNPSLVVEILSEGTGNHDRTGKLAWYRSLPSFREYLLIDSLSIHIDAFFLHEDGRWTIQNLYQREQNLRIYTLDLEIPLADIYRRVNF